MRTIVTVKPWGKEELLETNTHYVLKRLTMNAGHRCSLQYHRLKQETVYVVSGILYVYHGNRRDNLQLTTLSPGETITIAPHLIHRMEAQVDTVYLETSTSELDDVVRLEDDYQRL
jgi:mannose-6-phosphate isomerase